MKTKGAETPTMFHHVNPITIAVIVSTYLVFVGQLLIYTHWSDVPRRRGFAVMSLAVVFLFCALCGYATTLIDTPWIQGVREVMHIILAAAGIALVASNQAGTISRMMETHPTPPRAPSRS